MAGQPKQQKINLDKLFRKDSAARKVAEKLLTGEPVSRQQLADGKVSITTVNRVVQALEEAGAVVERQVVDRQAVYRVVSVGSPKRAGEYPALRQEARFVAAELVGDAMVVEFATDHARFRGVLKSLSRIPPLGKTVKVTGVSEKAQGLANVVVLPVGESKAFSIDNVQNITED